MASYNTPKRLFNFASTPPTEGLIAAWNLENVNDSFGVNHFTNNGGVTFVAGKLNNCAKFDGVDDYLSLADNANISYGAGKKFSACGWFKLNSYVAGASDILAKWGTAGNRDYAIEVVTADKSLQFFVSSDGTAATGVSTGANSILLNTWYFFVAWYDGNKLYLELNNNGVLFSAAYTGDIFNSTAALQLGREGALARFFDGYLDAIRLLKHDNRVLTANERTILYNNGLGKEFVSQTKVLASEVNSELNQIINLFNGISTDITPKLNVNLASPALTVNQNGAGAIFQCFNNAILKSEINNQGQLKSYLATGTAPIVMSAAATTRINNLNVDLLDDLNSTAFLQITSKVPLANIINFVSIVGGETQRILLSGDVITKIKLYTLNVGTGVSQFLLYRVSTNSLIGGVTLDTSSFTMPIVQNISDVTVFQELYEIRVSFTGSVAPSHIRICIETQNLPR